MSGIGIPVAANRARIFSHFEREIASKTGKIHAHYLGGRKSSLDYSSTISASQTFNVSTSGQQNFAVPGSLPGTVPP